MQHCKFLPLTCGHVRGRLVHRVGRKGMEALLYLLCGWRMGEPPIGAGQAAKGAGQSRVSRGARALKRASSGLRKGSSILNKCWDEWGAAKRAGKAWPLEWRASRLAGRRRQFG